MKKKVKFINFDNIMCTIIVFLILIIIPNIFSFKIFESFNQALSDFNVTDISFMKKLGRTELNPANEDIVLVNIDKVRPNELAMIINILNGFNPKVIAIEPILKRDKDTVFNEILSNTLKNIPKLVLSGKLKGYSKKFRNFNSIDKSDSMFSENARIGYTDFLFGDEKKYTAVRSFLPKTEVGGRIVYAFSVEAARKFNPQKTQKFLKIAKSKELINYNGTFSKYYLLQSDKILSGEFNPEIIKDKILLLGVVKQPLNVYRYHVLDEMYFTPLNENFSDRTFPDMYGLEIHANIINMILKENYFSSMPSWINVTLAFILCYLNLFIFSYISNRNEKWYDLVSILGVVLEAILILMGTLKLFQEYNYEINTTVAIFTVLLSVFSFELYNDSLKPLTKKAYYRFFGKGEQS